MRRTLIPRYHNVLLFLSVAVLFGLGYVAVKAGLAFFPPLLFAAFRIDIATVLLLVYAIIATHNWRPQTRGDWQGIIATSIFIIFASNVLQFLGQQYITSGVAAIIISLTPILTLAIAAALIPTERLSRVGMLGILVGLIGVGIVVDPDPNALLGGNLGGEELIFLSAASVAVGSVLLQRSNPSISSVALTGWAMLLAVPAMHVLSILAGESFASLRFSETAIIALVYVGVFATAIGYTFYFNLVDAIGSVQVSFVQYLLPVITAIGGWVFLNEQLPPDALIGFLVIFVGFLLLNIDEISKAIGQITAHLPRTIQR